MNILILNGSPKGENSITYQHVEYLKRKFPEHLYKTINVGSKIRSIEKDFSESKADLEWSELIIFCSASITTLIMLMFFSLYGMPIRPIICSPAS